MKLIGLRLVHLLIKKKTIRTLLILGCGFHTALVFLRTLVALKSPHAFSHKNGKMLLESNPVELSQPRRV